MSSWSPWTNTSRTAPLSPPGRTRRTDGDAEPAVGCDVAARRPEQLVDRRLRVVRRDPAEVDGAAVVAEVRVEGDAVHVERRRGLGVRRGAVDLAEGRGHVLPGGAPGGELGIGPERVGRQGRVGLDRHEPSGAAVDGHAHGLEARLGLPAQQGHRQDQDDGDQHDHRDDATDDGEDGATAALRGRHGRGTHRGSRPRTRSTDRLSGRPGRSRRSGCGGPAEARVEGRRLPVAVVAHDPVRCRGWVVRHPPRLRRFAPSRRPRGGRAEARVPDPAGVVRGAPAGSVRCGA